MSVPRYEKNFRFKNGTGYITRKIAGVSYEMDFPFSSIPVSIFYSHTTPRTDSIVDYRTLCNYGISVFDIPYFFNSAQEYNIANQLAAGTGKSAREIIAACLSKIEALMNSGQTGYIQSLNYPDLTSKDQGMFSTPGDDSFMVPYVWCWLARNEARPGNVNRYIEARIAIYTKRVAWDSTNNIWINNSNTDCQLVAVDYGGLYFEDFSSAVLDLANRAACISTWVGPELLSRQSGNKDIWYNVDLNYTWHYYKFHNEVISSNENYPYYISRWHREVSSPAWNSNGDEEPEDPTVEPDPYDPVPDPPVPPGPEPDPTPIDDPVPIPSLPPISGASVGIYKAFVPNSSQLRDIATKLWDPNAIETIKQMFTNPMEAILGLAIVPVNPVQGAPQPVYLGRYNTQVTVPVVSTDYVTVDCGSVAIKKFYGSYLDHDPYTKYSLYLPYIGEMELNADEITGRVLNVVYHCNVITGDVVAMVALDGRVCYNGMGNFTRQLPLSQTDYSSIIQTAVSAASTLLTAAVAGAGGAAVVNAAGAGSIAEVRAESRVASTIANGTTSSLTDVTGMKFNYKHSGKIGQGAGQLGVQKPFITINRPNLALPENNNLSQQSNLKAYTGYPCNKIVQLSACHGFTQIEACKLSVPGATDEEIAEIYSILKGGALL